MADDRNYLVEPLPTLPETDSVSLGIHQSDVILRTAILAGLADLRSNPTLLDYVFASLPRDALTVNEYGQTQVDAAKAWFMNTEIPVFMNTRIDEGKIPCITIALSASNEGQATLGDVHYETAEPYIEQTTETYFGPFVAAGYNPSTGILSLSTDFLGDVYPGMAVMTKDGKQYTITDVLDPWTLQIGIGIKNSFDGMRIISQNQMQVTLESLEFRETFDIGCHVAGEPIYLTYLHSILVFILLRYKEELLEARGLERTTISSTAVVLNTSFPTQQPVFTRMINMVGFVRQYWPKFIKRPLEGLSLQMLADGGTALVPLYSTSVMGETVGTATTQSGDVIPVFETPVYQSSIVNASVKIYSQGNLVGNFQEFDFTGDLTVTTVGVRAIINAHITNATNATVLASGSNTSRTLSARFGEIFNILDYGAIGDGVFDNTSAIRACIAAAYTKMFTFPSTYGVRIRVPQGSYKITDTIDWTGGLGPGYAIVVLEGDGYWASSIHYAGDPTKNIFNISQYMQIHDLYIDGSCKNTIYASLNNASYRRGGYNTFRNLYLGTGCTEWSINMASAAFVMFDNVTAYYGIKITRGGTAGNGYDSILRNCWVTDYNCLHASVLLSGFQFAIEGGLIYGSSGNTNPIVVLQTGSMSLRAVDFSLTGSVSQGYNICLGPPNYRNTDTFGVGDLVIYGGLCYQSLVDSNLNHQPDTSPAYWSVSAYNTNAIIQGCGFPGLTPNPGVAGNVFVRAGTINGEMTGTTNYDTDPTFSVYIETGASGFAIKDNIVKSSVTYQGGDVSLYPGTLELRDYSQIRNGLTVGGLIQTNYGMVTSDRVAALYFIGANSTIPPTLRSSVADGATAVANVIDTNASYVTGGAKLLSVRNAGVEKLGLDLNGGLHITSDLNVDGIIKCALYYPAGGPNPINLVGRALDGSTALGATFDTTIALTIAGAKLVSFRNAGVEKAFIDKDGGIYSAANRWLSNLIVNGGTTYCDNYWGGANGSTTTLMGRAVDGATAVSTVIDTSVSLITSGAKILSIRNNGVEKISVDLNGSFTAPGISALNGPVYALSFWGQQGNPAKLGGQQADGSTAIGVILNTQPAFTVAGSKLVSIQNNGVEKAYFDKDGILAVGTSRVYTASIAADSFYCAGGTYYANVVGPLTLKANGATDGATAVGVVLDTTNSFTTGGAKLLSIRNAGVEKLYIDKDGALVTTNNLSVNAIYNNLLLGPGNRSGVVDGATAVAFALDNSITFVTAGSKLVSIRNNTVEKAYFDLLGNIKAGAWATNIAVVTYSASMTPDSSLGSIQTITATNGTGFTINAPTNPLTGREISIRIINTSGGALGVAAWNAVFKMATWAQPASATSNTITFYYDGTNWIEIGRVVGIPN